MCKNLIGASPASPAWARLAVTAGELAFLVAMIPLERLAHGPAMAWLLRAGVVGPEAYYAAFLAVGAGAYLLWMTALARVLRRFACKAHPSPCAGADILIDNPAEAHLAEAMLAGIAILLPYALLAGWAWIALSALLALFLCLFDIQDLRRLVALPQQTLDEHRLPAALAQPLRQLAAREGLDQLNLLVSPPDRDQADQVALAQYIPTRGRPSFVFTRRLVDLLGEAQLRAVFAHELAHWKLGHSRKTLLAHAAGRLLAVVSAALVLQWARPSLAMGEQALRLAVPALLLWAVATIGVSLLFLAYMRCQERAAHVLAVGMTGDAAEYAQALRAIAACNGYRQPTWLARHLLNDTLSLDDALRAAGTSVRTGDGAKT